MDEHQDVSVPVSMLSGFLGAGKTTLLRHILQQSNLKIGCVVNDVASVNIDAKLIRNDTRQGGDGTVNTTADLTDTIELANGCACCSIADELFDSFENLLNIAKRRGIKYDRIVLENSGVAEPQNIRDQFNEAKMLQHPLSSKIHLDTLVTVVDSATFIQDYSSKAPIAARPDLGEGGGMRPVVDLLVEQVECADFVVLNKCDMLNDSTVNSLEAIIVSLNPMAKVYRCEYGRVDVDALLGPEVHGLVSYLNTEGHHKGSVAAAKSLLEANPDTDVDAIVSGKETSVKEDGHEHTHEHHHHEHEHHDHEHEHHHHEHEHHHREHEHHHREHEHGDCAACKKTSESRQKTTAASRFGIVSFVYERRRPFHPQRLKDLVLKWMPVSHNKAVEEGEGAHTASNSTPIRTVLRSKGFMWISNAHDTAFYWSHAGQHFEIRDEGQWWDAVDRAEWPEGEMQKQSIMSDFQGKYGDRRQEIVFIGAGMDQDAICDQLDGALITEEEMILYDKQFGTEAQP